VTLTLRALVNARPLEAPLVRGEGEGCVETDGGSVRIEVRDGAPPLWLVAPGATITALHDWYRGFALPRERERFGEAAEDHLCAAELRIALEPGDSFALLASARSAAAVAHGGSLALGTALARRRMHERSLLEMWRSAAPEPARAAPDWIRTLVLAADAFVAERATRLDPGGRTLLAGLPGPGDGGRDTMIALPGLTLATGRPELARAILATFARHVDQGMLPSRFPEDGAAPEYDAVDAGLWFFQAVRAYVEATGDDAFLESLYPVLEEIGAWHERGTRFGIGMDPEDALLRAGAPGVPLTWMDARAGGRPVTARAGKPVEVNALWYSALVTMVELAGRLGRPAENTAALAARVARGFERFWNPATRALYDVLDGPAGDDPALRPNQLLAISLPHSPLPRARQRAVLDSCGRWLLTSHGLRSLAPCEAEYRGADPDPAAAHQGAAWTWLLPHWALAVHRVTGDREAAWSALEPLGELVRSGVVGMLPGVAEGDPPHAPRGDLAQAWSVGEALRAWQALRAAKPAPRTARRAVLAGAHAGS
jgi:glycogen debranching enzyme